MNYLDEYRKWINEDIFDEKTKIELKEIKDNTKEIEDRFYKNLEFGTAGLRGIMGAGTNRMNKYTVMKATQGLANFINKEDGQDRGVVISYDSRNNSKEFAIDSALCLNANGIKTYIFESLRPVPELSYAVRYLNCIAGIMITASHNPAKYNGYKVYWEDGAQITAPKDKQIIEEVNKVKEYKEIKLIDIDKAKEKKLYNLVGKEIDDNYIKEIKKQVLNADIIRKQAKNLKIVYTPLHGTGSMLVKRILKELEFESVYVVPEQEQPDGDFPTVHYPNPEDKNAFKLALNLAKKVDADLVLATDPDADRLGVYAKNSETNEYMSFTGNMSGMLIAEYLLSQRKEKGILPQNGALITTIVSTNLAKAVSNEYNLKLFEVLTGFKYIGEKIKEFEQTGKYSYQFGFEESYGCLIGTHARDKDAICAVMSLCEAAAYYKDKGLTLWDQMISIYKKYGYYKEEAVSLTFEGVDGANKITKILDDLRNEPLTEIGNFKVIKFRDYRKEIIKDLITGKEEKTGLPNSNVLYFELENDGWCCVRPSGTEPKVKFYLGVKSNCIENADKELELMKQDILKINN